MNGELIAVRQFVELADRVGLPIPGLHPIYRQDGADRLGCLPRVIGGRVGTAEWPKPTMLDLLAIAQHHGVPTRLLDFTFDALVALYFAAQDPPSTTARPSEESSDCLAVWGIDVDSLRRAMYDFTVVEVERSRNPFVAAQRALFVLDLRICDTPDGVPSPSFDERMLDFNRKGSPPIDIRRFVLPRSLASEAIRMLRPARVDQAHLMPTYDNVVGDLRSASGQA